MTDRELDRLLQSLSPIKEERVAALDLQRADIELMEDVMSSPSPAVRDRKPGRTGRRRWLTRGVGGVSAAAALTALVIALVVGGNGARPEFAAAAVKVAEANSRILVDEPGWSIVRSAEFTVDSGEMTFSDGKDELEVFWKPRRYYRSYLRDRGLHTTRTKVTVLGRKATRFDSTDPNLRDLHVTLLPPEGSNFVEIRADTASTERYMDLLASLKAVEVETWLAALRAAEPSIAAAGKGRPDLVDQRPVLPEQRPAVVDEMLEGLPLPDGLDVAALRDHPAVMNRYDLGALVSGAVACAWLDRWTAADAAGATAAANEAKAALRTARDWRVLKQMPDQTYNSVLWGYADAVEDPARAKAEQNVDLRFYRGGLGCRYAQSVVGRG